METTIDLSGLAPDTLRMFAEATRRAAERPEMREAQPYLEILAVTLEREARLRGHAKTMGATPLIGQALGLVARELSPVGLRLAQAYVLALRDAEAGAAAVYRALGLPALAESRAAAAEFAQALLLALDDEKKDREEAFRRALERMADAGEG